LFEIDDDRIPPVSEYLVEALKARFNVNHLLTEGNSEGLERLGFLKGAQYILSCLANISIQQREDVEE
jgi:hypothetical protein